MSFSHSKIEVVRKKTESYHTRTPYNVLDGFRGDDMWFLIGIQLFLILLFSLLGWAIVKKEAYWLISNFNGRTTEEQKQLVKNGFPQRVGKLMLATSAGMAILLPLTFTSFNYSMDLQFGFMIIFLLGGLVYLSKYELPAKKKSSYIISSVLAIGTISFLGALSYFGYEDFEIKTNKDTFQITGMYGDEWHYSDLQTVKLLDEMPEITWKQNGFGLSTMAKGRFIVEDYGSSLLFIHKGSSPYLYIEVDGEKIFFNQNNPEQTKKWYKFLSEKMQ
jgi:hypothetical protein